MTIALLIALAGSFRRANAQSLSFLALAVWKTRSYTLG